MDIEFEIAELLKRDANERRRLRIRENPNSLTNLAYKTYIETLDDLEQVDHNRDSHILPS